MTSSYYFHFSPLFPLSFLSGSVAPRQLTDVAKSKRTFERNQFRHAKLTPPASLSITLQRLYRFFSLLCVTNVLHTLFIPTYCRVERATDDTMPSSSSISTRARVLLVPALSADRAHCLSLSLSLFFLVLSCSAVRYLLCSPPQYHITGRDCFSDVIFVNIFFCT